MQTKLIISAIATVAVLGSAAVAYPQGIEWAIVNWKVRHDFPSVSRIGPKALAEWLNDPQRRPPVLLDVRTKPEYAISHLHGAQRVDPDSSAQAIKLPRDQPILTYCSVGYRSGAFAKKLQEAGFTDVRNMSGSIFEWANEGHPVERNGRRVEQVHPYNEKWAKLLKPSLRADVPMPKPGK